MTKKDRSYENRVSFDTAKLACEKGFDKKISTIFGSAYYNYKGTLNGDVTKELTECFKIRKDKSCSYDEASKINPFRSYNAPTFSELQKWLLDEKGIFVYPRTYCTQKFTDDNKIIMSFKPSIEILTSVSLNTFTTELKYDMFQDVEPMSFNSAFNLGLYEALRLI